MMRFSVLSQMKNLSWLNPVTTFSACWTTFPIQIGVLAPFEDEPNRRVLDDLSTPSNDLAPPEHGDRRTNKRFQQLAKNVLREGSSSSAGPKISPHIFIASVLLLQAIPRDGARISKPAFTTLHLLLSSKDKLRLSGCRLPEPGQRCSWEFVLSMSWRGRHMNDMTSSYRLLVWSILGGWPDAFRYTFRADHAPSPGYDQWYRY
jgi:hypothetical protein